MSADDALNWFDLCDGNEAAIDAQNEFEDEETLAAPSEDDENDNKSQDEDEEPPAKKCTGSGAN